MEDDLKVQDQCLTEKDIEILEEVCERFADMNAREISLESHREKGWIENHASKLVIDYRYAFDLSTA